MISQRSISRLTAALLSLGVMVAFAAPAAAWQETVNPEDERFNGYVILQAQDENGNETFTDRRQAEIILDSAIKRVSKDLVFDIADTDESRQTAWRPNHDDQYQLQTKVSPFEETAPVINVKLAF